MCLSGVCVRYLHFHTVCIINFIVLHAQMVYQSHLQLSFMLYRGLPLDLLFSSASVELSLLLRALY